MHLNGITLVLLNYGKYIAYLRVHLFKHDFFF